MADKRIEELPILNTDDFNPFNDFVVVQQPGSGTYKMVVGQAFAGSASRSLLDSKMINFTSSDQTIDFNELDILSTNTSWRIDFATVIVSMGSRNGGLSTGQIRIGNSLIKKESFDDINGSNIGGKFNHQISQFVGTYAGTIGKTQVTKSAAVTYTASVDTSVFDRIRINVSRSGDPQVLSEVNIKVDITGIIKP